MANTESRITAEDIIPDIEKHFKVSAGPGAGKTRWLTNHIKHVVRSSQRLGNARKIACITFTNIAAETILSRLGPQMTRVEVSTIHSFLYNNLIKPFAFLIPSDLKLNIYKMDGHDDVPIYKGMLYEWKKKTNQMYLSDDAKVTDALKDLSWQLDNGDMTLKTRKPWRAKIGSYNIKKDSFLEYKKMCWCKGLIDHDDVLFFGLTLLIDHPRLLDLLRKRFPYFFIDEFQDTNPIQTEIIKRIAQKETIVGVIGDVAQSIYAFQGAKPEQFKAFTLPGIQNLSIADNHRCTEKITNLLNSIRSDLKQHSRRNLPGDKPVLLVGMKFWALEEAKKCAQGSIQTLSRNNITAI